MKSVGKVIVGVSTLLMVFVLVSGIFIWVPRTKRALKNRLCIATDKGIRRFWYDSHVALGIYVVIFLLIMALTGLTWSFGWYRTAFYALFDNPGKGFVYGLHTGAWGGITTKVIYFISSFIGGVLPLSGYYLWWKKRK